MENANDSTAVMSPEDMSFLKQARQMNAKPAASLYDTIKFKDSEKKVEGLTRGNYFIESYDGEKKTYRDIGPDPEIIILHRVFTYSYYKEGEGLKAWTNDIQGFSDTDFVQLYSKKSGMRDPEFSGTYKQFKIYAVQNYIAHNMDGSTEKLLSFQNLLYVLFEGKIYRMFVSNASAAGIAPGERGGDFKHPQPLSLLHFIETTREQPGKAVCEYICKLGSYFKDDVEQPFYIRTFENIGENPDTPSVIKLVKKILIDASKQQREIEESCNISQAREVMSTEVIDA